MSQLELILSRLSGVRNAPSNNYQANCPCPHHSKTNNGKLYLKDNGEMVLMDCKSGCTASEVLYELELSLKDLYPPTGPQDRQEWINKQSIRNAAKKVDDDAIKLWTELCVLKEVLQHRIFNSEPHPTCRNDLWDREKEATRLLGKRFKEYYRF